MCSDICRTLDGNSLQPFFRVFDPLIRSNETIPASPKTAILVASQASYSSRAKSHIHLRHWCGPIFGRKVDIHVNILFLRIDKFNFWKWRTISSWNLWLATRYMNLYIFVKSPPCVLILWMDRTFAAFSQPTTKCTNSGSGTNIRRYENFEKDWKKVSLTFLEFFFFFFLLSFRHI